MRELGGECDFAKDIAQPYTLRVIMDIYGVPESDEPLMMDLTQGIFGAADPEFLGGADDPGQRVIESVMTFIQYFNEITEDRRACPTDDLASVIANGEIDGCPMGDSERLWYYIIVATAGHDTTSFGLAGGMEALLRDPDQLWALRDDPDLVVNATDECIRWTTPVRHFMRYSVSDEPIESAACRSPPADASCSRTRRPTATRTSSPTRCASTSAAPTPTSSSRSAYGAHFCLGAQFARREIRTMLGRLTQQLDAIEPAGDPEWAMSHFVSGVKHLPVSYRFRD